MVDSIIDRISQAIANEMDCGTIREHELPKVARAILQAIHDPSEAMSKAGGLEGDWSDWYERPDEYREQATEVWHAMIDAALEEK